MIKVIKNVLVFTAIAIGCAGLAACIGYTSEQLKTSVPPVAELQKSVVDITIKETITGTPVGGCSGWVLKGSHNVVTAAHCMATEDVTLYANFGDGVDHELKTVAVGDFNWKTGPDLAILTPTDDKSITFPVGLPVCTKPVQIGDFLGLFGSPLGIKSNVSFGYVSNVGIDVSGLSQGSPEFTKHFLGYDGQAFPGNSGGPAVKLNEGCVVGVAEFIFGGNGSNYGINALTPIGDLEKLHV
jgi:S1-C subfamily serine protease